MFFMDAIGIDFGTTNTVFAFPEGKDARVLGFNRDGAALDALRTTLSFRRNPLSGGKPLAEAGPWAIQDFIDAPEDTRFLQSFKSFAASNSFTDTAVFTNRYRFEDLMAAYLGKLKEHGGLDRFPKRLAICMRLRWRRVPGPVTIRRRRSTGVVRRSPRR